MTPVAPQDNAYPAIAAIADQFAPISLAEMDAVALLSRVDQKYILTSVQVGQVLQRLTDHYWILEVAQTRLQHYYTLYFDTATFTLYQQHHNGGQNRHKVRFRQYVDSQQVFLEVKSKTNKGRTLKTRQHVAAVTPELEPAMQAFVAAALPIATPALEPKLWNRFVRLTLVSKQHIERLTLDLNLSFGVGRQSCAFSHLAIAEVKQESAGRQSAFVQQMRALHALELNFSKYCIGAALHYPHLKQNNFKPVFLYMQKLGAAALSSTIEPAGHNA
jgi:hypothetical protein